jgi:hypothetical protein
MTAKSIGGLYPGQKTPTPPVAVVETSAVKSMVDDVTVRIFSNSIFAWR